jgi:hypothetical protein
MFWRKSGILILGLYPYGIKYNQILIRFDKTNAEKSTIFSKIFLEKKFWKKKTFFILKIFDVLMKTGYFNIGFCIFTV